MAEPSKKSLTLEQAISNFLGVSRTETIAANKCVLCGMPAKEFKDELSATEYTISGMCQTCQDSTF